MFDLTASPDAAARRGSRLERSKAITLTGKLLLDRHEALDVKQARASAEGIFEKQIQRASTF